VKKELVEDEGGGSAVEEKVIPLDRGADEAGEDNAAGARGGGGGNGSGHGGEGWWQKGKDEVKRLRSEIGGCDV